MKISKLFLISAVSLSFCVPFAYAQEEESGPADSMMDGYMDDSVTDEFETLGPSQDGVKDAEPAVDESGLKQEKYTPSQEKGTLEGVTPEIYTISHGDNLWDICARFLGNSFEWPKLWSINQYITNPHFIYPGAKIIFTPGTEVSAPKMEMAREVEPGSSEKTVEEAKPVQTAKEAEVQGEPQTFQIQLKTVSFLTKKELEAAGTITHSGEPKKMLCSGDSIYLKFGKKNAEKIQIGDRFVAFDVIKIVRHPIKGNSLGYQIFIKSNIKITGIDANREVFTGFIIDCERDVARGDKVIPFSDIIVKLNPQNLDSEITGYIVGSEPEHVLIGQQEFAYVDLGLKKGVVNGTLLYVVRRGDGLVAAEDKKLPYVVVGKLLVVDAKDNTSTVYVMDSDRDLEVGDVIKTKF